MIAKQNIPLYCLVVLGVVFTLLTPAVLAQELTAVPFEGRVLLLIAVSVRVKRVVMWITFFELADRILDVLIWLAVLGVAIVFTYHGVRLAVNVFLPGGAESEVKKAKSAMIWSLGALVLVLSSYLIVEFFFDVFGYKYDPFDYTAQVMDKSETGTLG